ncbi:MAG TPA: hypothetical protein VGE86_01945 [Thermoanaerobaculia bacterium]
MLTPTPSPPASLLLRPTLARPLRYNVPGGIYHVTSRGNERREIVRDDADRVAFVDRLANVVTERGWLLHSWVLMTNHFPGCFPGPGPNFPGPNFPQLPAPTSSAWRLPIGRAPVGVFL